VLHAHLPYIRHPEHDYFLEENWFYEAITETYIPLFDLFSRLTDDGINFRMTLSITPTLIEMFNDRLLMERYERHIERLIELSEREVSRTKRDIHFAPVARMYRERFQRIRYLFDEVYEGDLVHILRHTGYQHRDYFANPRLSTCPSIRRQLSTDSRIDVLQEEFRTPSTDGFRTACAGFRYYGKRVSVFLDTQINQKPCMIGVYAPVLCPAGICAFGRDAETSGQVWSSIGGYPGDYDYRDFYRDIGFDIDKDHIKSFLHPYGTKTYTGLKYYRITGKTDRKEPYVIQRARDKAAEHAANFVMNREVQVNVLSETHGISPVITATYDAELFGHW
jgi:1,4-alpha-glucan branching enzyme